jgi:hypothetical protein
MEKDMEPIIHITYQVIYVFEGWKFEYDRNKPFGPWPLTKDDDPRARAGRKFYSMFDLFLKLPLEEQEKLRII